MDKQREAFEALDWIFKIADRNGTYSCVEEYETVKAALASQPAGEPVAHMCPAGCGCLWRDNKDGSMSLFGPNSTSCEVCERTPLDGLAKVYAAGPEPQQ